jgi:threonine synthase
MPSLRCLACKKQYPTTEKIYTCPACDGLLDVTYPLDEMRGERLMSLWDWRRASPQTIDQSGVWRFRELLPTATEEEIVTLTEGNTQIWDAPRSAKFAGVDRLALKHLGMNPTGSFKDLGMTTGITQARRLGAEMVACASTGNTSASMAAYAARAGMKSFVFIPSGQIALGKLSQALDYGAVVLQIEGDFDDAMRLVREVANETPIYLLNSINPFRLEGQKTIAFELLQQRGWQVPDRIVVPGGNLGNSSAIAKGFHELLERGVITRLPKISIIQAEGSNPLYRMWQAGAEVLTPVSPAWTLATAIKIGSPVSWPKALRGLKCSQGSVESVNEQEIADAKAIIGSDGIGCEPASAVTVAGIRKLVAAREIDPAEDIVAILTGHVLKDPDYTVNYHRHTLTFTDPAGVKVPISSNYANAFIQVPSDKKALLEVLNRR